LYSVPFPYPHYNIFANGIRSTTYLSYHVSFAKAETPASFGS